MPDCRDTAPLEIRHVFLDDDETHPSAANGVHNAVRRLATEQKAAGDDPRILVLQSGTPREVAAPTRAEVFPLVGLAIGRHVIRLDRSVLRQLLASAGARSHFHLHGGRQTVMVDIARALCRQGIPYALTLHGRYSHLFDDQGHTLQTKTALYLRLAERRLLGRAHFVQALSKRERDVLARIAPTARIEVVGNGAYASRNQGIPPLPGTRARSPNFPVFAYCGRYAVHHKGLDLLLQGFALFRRAGFRGELRMIGTGEERQNLIRMSAELGIADAVHMGGPAFGHSRDAALAACDYFVMCSRFEGLPLTALEAACLGMPLIMSVGTGLSEMVERHSAGFGISHGTARDVCDAMRMAAVSGEEVFRAQCAAAYRMALSIGDWTQVAARLRLLYFARDRPPPEDEELKERV